MIHDAREGVIDGIVVYSIDRLTRRITELTSFLEEQKEHGFAFATTEDEDTSTEAADGRPLILEELRTSADQSQLAYRITANKTPPKRGALSDLR